MRPATEPRGDRDATRLLVIDPCSHQRQDAQISDLPRYLRPGDLLVLNDAATLPGSLPAHTARGEPIELRLAGPAERDQFQAVVFGAGDYRTRTEDRAAPPELAAGDEIRIGDGTGLTARVSACRRSRSGY
jgi:S-adenosylmethionine:tRNA ribosyltransferase-isomerase